MSGIKVRIAKSAVDTQMDLPLAENGIVAGFPSPADDFFEVSIDLNKELIKHPSATFYGRVEGDSMRDEGIEDGDLLVIDRSLEPSDGKIAVCFIDGEFTVKKIKIEKYSLHFQDSNPDYKPVKVTAENEFIIWGIVTYVIKKK